MAYLPDTNIVLRLVNKNDPLHQAVSQAVRKLEQNGEKLIIIPQILVEFWAVATRPKSANGLEMSVEETGTWLESLQTLFVLLPENAKIFDEWKALVTKYKVSGKPSHDARIVAAMKVHKIDKILTLNPQDFKRYTEIISITPQEVLDET